MEIKCPGCNQYIDASAKFCPSCGRALTAKEQPAKPARVACPDGNCVGIIGENGKCRKCGKGKESITNTTVASRSAVKLCPKCMVNLPFGTDKCKNCGHKIRNYRVLGLLAFLLILGFAVSRNQPSSQQPPKVKTEAEIRQDKIAKAFSPWDGSHRNLEAIVKKSMNDPGSYEHVDTTYADKDDYLLVKTNFRGKNAFGGVVINHVIAKTDLDGNILEIVSQGR